MNSSSPRQQRLGPIRARLRVPLGLGSLLILIYLLLGWLFLKPLNIPQVSWRLDGTARLDKPVSVVPSAELSTITTTQPGDVLLAIDGIPYLLSDWQFRYSPPAEYHTYEFQRGTQRYTVRLVSGQPPVEKIFHAVVYSLIFLATWAFGFLIILFASVNDEAAWLVGLGWIAFSLSGASYMALPQPAVPGTRLIFETVTPFLLVSYFESAFLPGQANLRYKTMFKVLYGLAAVFAGLAIVEVFLLNPRFTWEMFVRPMRADVSSIGLDELYYNIAVMGMCTVPVILACRIWRLSPGPVKRQVWILLAATVPILLPVFAPSGILYLLALPLVLVLPAGYGYVIYRHRYLQLDIFVSRSLIAIFAAVLVSILYLLGTGLARQTPALASLESVIGLGILLMSFALMGRINDRLRQGVDLLLYGSQHDLERALADVTAQLSANPQFGTLKSHLLIQVTTVLHVKQAALLIGHDDLLWPLGMVQVEEVAPLSPALLMNLPEMLLRQVESENALFQAYPWAWLVAPLRSRAKVEGVLLLGRKIPDGFYNAKEVAFLQQVTAAATIAIENTRLFEALREMSRDLLRVRMLERWQLSARLHDEPLQRASAIVYQLEQLLSPGPPLTENELALGIRRQKEEVRALAQELRDICSGLRPPILDQGLLLTLREIVNNFRRKLPEAKLTLATEGCSPPILPSEDMDAIYHVVTEALNNVVKHACATQVAVNLICLPDAVGISVTDDGRGVPRADLSLSELLRNHHFGIAGMYQWMEMVGGELQIDPYPSRGTQVHLSLPLKQRV